MTPDQSFSDYLKEMTSEEGIKRFNEQCRLEEEQRDAQTFRDANRQCDHCKGEGAKFVCSACKCRYYCGKACQKAAWTQHKPECQQFKEVRKVPVSTADEFLMEELGYHWHMGVGRTKRHGHFIYITDKLCSTGEESNRQVPLAMTMMSGTEPSEPEMLQCLVDAVAHPKFLVCSKSANGHQYRKIRNYRLTLLTNTIRDPVLIKGVSQVATRLGMKVRSNNEPLEDGSWEYSWCCVQMGWNDEITDQLFISMIARNRWRPTPDNTPLVLP